jgi:hypothetical protein
LRQLRIEHEFLKVPGVAHDTMALLEGVGEENWEFYRAAFAAQPTTAEKPEKR